MGGRNLFPEETDTSKTGKKGRNLFATPETSASPFLQRGVDMTAAAIKSPGKGETRRVGKAGKLDAKNDRIRLSQSAQRAYANQVAAERRARVMPVEQAAGRAGAAAMGPGLMDEANPNAAYSEFMLSPEQQQGMQAERGVYRDKDVISSVDAASLAGINATALGVPGFVSKDFRNELGQAQADQPGAYAGGTIVGSALPFQAGWDVGRGIYNTTLKPAVNALMPKGGSALARGARVTQRYGEQVGGFGLNNAALQATVGESNAAAAEGRDPSFASAMNRAGEGLTDPINALIPGVLMGANRVGKLITSGGRTMTPDSIAAEIAGRTAGKSGDGSILDAGMLGGDVDRRAETILFRMLREAGFSRNDIRGGLASFKEVAQGLPEGPVLTSRLKDVLIDKLGERAETVVQKFLQGAGVSPGAASTTVERAVREDYGRLGQFLEDSANARLGSGSRPATNRAVQQEMDRIGGEYEKVFSQPATDQAAVEDLQNALEFFANSDLAGPLRKVAAGKMLSVEDMIRNDPRQAAHWMQMAANRIRQTHVGKDDVLANAYEDMRTQILSRLEQPGVAPGYQQARMQFGDEFGTEQALTFGSRFFTKVGDTMGLQALVDGIERLAPQQQEAALLSIRDELLRISGKHRKGMPPRMEQISNQQALGGLEAVLGEQGGKLSNDIQFINDRLARLRKIDPVTGKSSTTPSGLAYKEADAMVANPTMRRVGNALQALGGDALLTSGTGSFLPIMSARSLARKAGDALAKGRQGKIDDVTSLLMRDVGASPRPAMPGDDLPPLTSRGGGAVPPPSAFSEVSSNAQTVEPRNALAEPEALRQAVAETAPLYRQTDADVRWENIRSATRLEARNRGETLTPEQVDEAAAEMYRAMYKLDPPGMKGSRDMKAEGWVRSVEDAKRSLDRDMGPGTYTAEELEAEATRFYGEYYGYGSVPPNSMELPSKLVGQQVDLVDFANRVVDAERLNATTKDMTIEDMVDLARRYDKAYKAKGGKGVTELEQMGHDIAQAADKSLPPKASGLGAVKDELGQQAILAGFGSIGGSANDLNGDGKKDWKDAAIGAAGAMVGVNGVRAAGAARNALAGAGKRTVGKTRTAGVPKTPQQAARFETPGSPEWEAAKAKGLDMSQAGRKSRAQEQGYNTDEVLYHGTDRAGFDQFDVNAPARARSEGEQAIFLTDKPAKASTFAGVETPSIMPLYVRGRIKTVTPDDAAQLMIPGSRGQQMAYRSKDFARIIDQAKAEGFDGVRFKNVNEGAVGDQIAIFDPSNIRSVNAAFDPDKAASPILTAGAGGKRPPKPDSPDAIKNALRDIAKAQPKEPTRLERMVRDNQIPVNSPDRVAPDAVQSAGNRAQRMAERGKDPFEIYDETSIVFVPYNGQNIPIYSTQQGPEEVIRTFYSWLREPKETWPQFVTDIVNQAPKKRTMRLGDENAAAVPPGAIPQPAPPMPKAGFPVGGAAIGAAAGAATGIPGGALIGYAMTQNERKPRNALAAQ